MYYSNQSSHSDPQVSTQPQPPGIPVCRCKGRLATLCEAPARLGSASAVRLVVKPLGEQVSGSRRGMPEPDSLRECSSLALPWYCQPLGTFGKVLILQSSTRGQFLNALCSTQWTGLLRSECWSFALLTLFSLTTSKVFAACSFTAVVYAWNLLWMLILMVVLMVTGMSLSALVWCMRITYLRWLRAQTLFSSLIKPHLRQ